jgi:hypothetical protein
MEKIQMRFIPLLQDFIESTCMSSWNKKRIRCFLITSNSPTRHKRLCMSSWRKK